MMDRLQISSVLDYMIGSKSIGVAGDEEIIQPYSPELRAFFIARLGYHTPPYGNIVMTEGNPTRKPFADCLREIADGIDTRMTFDLVSHLYRQRAFSERTFGPGSRTRGVIDHIRKELIEIENDPSDISEWIDVVLLALDGAWRAGHSPEHVAAALKAKQIKNENRKWPDWRTMDPDKGIEHDRSGEVS